MGQQSIYFFGSAKYIPYYEDKTGSRTPTFIVQGSPEIGPSLHGPDQHRSNHVPVLADQELHGLGVVQVSFSVQAEVVVALHLHAELDAEVACRVLLQLRFRSHVLDRVVLVGRLVVEEFYKKGI